MSDEQKSAHGAEEEPLRIPELKRSVDTILIPVDGSPGSELGLAYADLVARIANAKLVVVVAYDPPAAIRRRGILQVQHLRAEMEDDARALAIEAAQLLIDRGRDARAVVVKGDPSEAILQTADDEHVDLIVMSRRGLGRLQGLLVGSVSERVARHANVPVFLVS